MGKKLTYSETPEDRRWVADILEDNGFHEYAIYNYGSLYNVNDSNGIIQSFYSTTGTIGFHRSNVKSDHAQKHIKNDSPEEGLDLFMWYLARPEEIQKFFS